MLKNNNYQDKRTGLTLPVVALAQVDTARGKADFFIGISREAIEKGNIIDSKSMYMKFDRNENPFEFAYRKAKEKREIPWYNPETHKEETKLVDGIFTGWEDEY